MTRPRASPRASFPCSPSCASVPFWRTPDGVEHSVRTADEGAVVLDIFAPPRDKYRKLGEGFGV